MTLLERWNLLVLFLPVEEVLLLDQWLVSPAFLVIGFILESRV